ncbi:MAG: hypothetical protein ACP5U1_07480 [Desulfomonilaceae bacterium]
MPVKKRNGSAPRKLFYIPIIHTETDMGALGASIKTAYIKKMGLQAWKRKKELIERFWTDLENAIHNINLPYSKTRVYQDGLPVSDPEQELKIVKKLATDGSRNHELVQKLIDRGATLVGTESPELLMQEYHLAMSALNPTEPGEGSDDQKTQAANILKKRDEFIAKRIDQTLKQGEVGILFIGSLHNVIPLLNSDIEVITPLASSARG